MQRHITWKFPIHFPSLKAYSLQLNVGSISNKDLQTVWRSLLDMPLRLTCLGA